MGRRYELGMGATVELNEYGQRFVESNIAKIDEDAIYASIGAYDPEAFAKYLEIERQRFIGIAFRHQFEPEFQYRYRSRV